MNKIEEIIDILRDEVILIDEGNGTIALTDSEYQKAAERIVKLFAIPDVVWRSEQLKADLYKFRDMFCQNVDLSSIDEYVDELGF
jgi:hypothetical protein